MADTCYTISSDSISSTNQYFPCGSGGGAQTCCYGEDVCMEDGICHFTRGGVVNGTGYYMAGCTDSTWQDPACPKQCASEFTSDIIYNRAESYWNCCTSDKGYLSCQEPSDLVVKAPPPDALSTVLAFSSYVPSATATTSVGELQTSNPTTHAAATSKAADTDKGLSTGAEAGVAVAAAVAVFLLAGGIYFCCRRKRRRQSEFTSFPDEGDSTYSRRNTLHSTIAPTIGSMLSNRRNTFSSSVAPPGSAGLTTNRNTMASSNYPSTNANRSTMVVSSLTLNNTNRNTVASSHYASSVGSPRSPGIQHEPMPPLPSDADGIQVVKQLPWTPEDLLHSQEKFAYISVEDRGVQMAQGRFEMHGSDGIEMQQRPKSVQELAGTTVEVAELDGKEKRQSRVTVAEVEDDEYEEEGMIEVGMVQILDEHDAYEDLRAGSRQESRPSSIHQAEQISVQRVAPTSHRQSGLIIDRSRLPSVQRPSSESQVPSSPGGDEDGKEYDTCSEGHSSTRNLRRADSTTLGTFR